MHDPNHPPISDVAIGLLFALFAVSFLIAFAYFLTVQEQEQQRKLVVDLLACEEGCARRSSFDYDSCVDACLERKGYK